MANMADQRFSAGWRAALETLNESDGLDLVAVEGHVDADNWHT